MWLAIINAIDKLLGIFGQVAGWLIKRSDESNKIRREEQIKMDEAAKKGDFDAWKIARHKRNRG